MAGQLEGQTPSRVGSLDDIAKAKQGMREPWNSPLEVNGAKLDYNTAFYSIPQNQPDSLEHVRFDRIVFGGVRVNFDRTQDTLLIETRKGFMLARSKRPLKLRIPASSEAGKYVLGLGLTDAVPDLTKNVTMYLSGATATLVDNEYRIRFNLRAFQWHFALTVALAAHR